MRIPWIVVGWGLGAIAVLAGCEAEVVVVDERLAVETSFEAICEQHCACLACDEAQEESCLVRGAALDDDAEASGCTDALAVYVACAEREYECQPNEGAKATCEAELTAYYDCKSAPPTSG
jgi:hypothetical protein